MTRTGVIGLGRMGSAVAARMAAQGVSVTGWTRSGLSAARAADLGITVANDIPALVAGSDVILTSLFDDAAVAAVLDALLDTDLAGKLIVETSTVVPTLLTDRIDRIEALGGMAVDAPISGGPEMVAAGICGIFMGGSAAAAARTHAALTPLTARLFHVGPLGAGLVMKTINNALIQVYVSGLRDLLPMAKRAGLPLETVLEILSRSPAGMPMVTDRIPKILGHDTEVGFPLSAVVKDNDVFRRVAADYGLDAPSLAYAGDRQRAMVSGGLGDEDLAAAIAAAYDAG